MGLQSDCDGGFAFKGLISADGFECFNPVNLISVPYDWMRTVSGVQALLGFALVGPVLILKT